MVTELPERYLGLQTGELGLHRREDYITVVLPIAYNPDAECPRFLAFISWAMKGRKELVQYLKRLVGYSLNGLVLEHILIIFYGTGDNGKSTFIDLFLKLLVGYSIKTSLDLFMEARGERHPTERMDLFGKRFAATTETEEGRRLSIVFVKEATGGDPIKGRRMREDPWEFWPSHTVFMSTNHIPVIGDRPQGMWRRVKLIPWEATIDDAERDRYLPDKLWVEREGILAWAVQGHMDWLAHGLGEPEVVKKATADYRTSQDVVAAFISDCCLTGEGYEVWSTDLYLAFQEWCDKNGEKMLSQRALGQQLAELKYENARGAGGRRKWKGMGCWRPLPNTTKTHKGPRQLQLHRETRQIVTRVTQVTQMPLLMNFLRVPQTTILVKIPGKPQTSVKVSLVSLKIAQQMSRKRSLSY